MVENQQDHSVDNNRIKTLPKIAASFLDRMGLQWFEEGENAGYISDTYIKLTPEEVKEFKTASANLYELAKKAARLVAKDNRWEEVGIPEEAIALMQFSIQHELDLHLVSRFDFAGGIDSLPIKFLEINADTCSLMPETAYVQEEYWKSHHFLPHTGIFNNLIVGMTEKFKNILRQNPDMEPTILLSGMGYPEDDLNVQIVGKAARKAGFTKIHFAPLDKVIFSPDEGVYLEITPDNFIQFDFWYKFSPWDFIVFDEPELLDVLDNLITQRCVIVLNPAWTMIMQSKGIMKVMYEMEPNNPYLLKTGMDELDFPNDQHIEKPMFGRMGENVALYDQNNELQYEVEGDYGGFPKVSQEVALFNIDDEEHRYQPSIFWSDKPTALCIRRQDDPIIDDDAEFVGHLIE